MERNIEIQKKTRPVVLIVFVVLVIGIFGIWTLISLVFPLLHGFWELKIFAITAIVVVIIWAAYLIITQSSRTKPGLIIGEQGITDYSTVTSIGFIPWSDITSVQESADTFRRKLIILIVKNPDVYINKASMMRESLQVRYQEFGSPIVIATGNLEYDPQVLVSTIKRQQITKALGYGE